MPASSKRTPKNTIKVRRQLKAGDELMIPVTITQTWDGDRTGAGAAVTLRIPGYGYPVTVPRRYLQPEGDE